jgi:predicted DNA-binding transcriptional regulator AlpA
MVNLVDVNRIDVDRLDQLFREGFTVTMIAEQLQVSRPWLYAWMKQTGYERPQQYILQNEIGDAFLDALIREYIFDKPEIGERMTWAYIEYLGYRGKLRCSLSYL